MQRSGSISEKVTEFVIRKRTFIILASILLGACFGILIPFSETDPEIRNYVPETMDSRKQTDLIEKEFGVQDLIVLVFSDSSILQRKNLEAIRKADRALSHIPGIANRTSPFTIRNIRNEDGAMVADKLIRNLPDDSSGVNELARSIRENRFALGTVFSDDLTTAVITAFIDNRVPEKETLARVDSIVETIDSDMTIQAGGLPYIRKYIIDDVKKDAIVLVPLALMIMLLILKFTLGAWKSVLLPFSVVLISTLTGMGLLPLFGWKMSIMTLLVPVIMIAVANNYGIYLTARSQEICGTEQGITGRELLKRLFSSLNMPILFSALTTIAGILGLLSHSIIPARQVGVLASIGVTVALILSMILIPSLIYQYGTDSGRTTGILYGIGLITKIISKLSEKVIKHSSGILIIFLLLTICLSAGIFFVRIDTNQENYFPENHPVKHTSEVINKKFGGSQTISVMLSGDILDPEVMNGIDRLTETLENEKGVGRVFSISVAVREMSKAIFNQGEAGYNSIPVTRDGIAQMFELYYMSGDSDDFKQLVSTDYTIAQILVKLSDPSNNNIDNIKLKINNLTNNIPVKVNTGGYAIIMDDFAGKIIDGQASSLIIALVTVIILLSIIFKSFSGGLIGSIPLAVSIIVVFGFMGAAGIALDAATALLSSIMIGVGVDFTIQYIWCFRMFVNTGEGYVESTRKAMTTIGRSIVVNAISVMAGFSVLMFSGFMSIRFFGFLVFISIGTCLVGAIILIPAFIIRFRPSFLVKNIVLNNNSKYENNSDNISVAGIDLSDDSTVD